MSQETVRYPCFFKPETVSQAHKDPHLEHKNFPKKLKIYPKMTKTGVIKKVDHHPINYTAAYYQILEQVPGPMLLENIKKHKKIANTLKKLLKFLKLKS